MTAGTPVLHLGPRCQQGPDVEREVAGDVRAHHPDGQRVGALATELVTTHHPKPERRVVRRPGEPAALVVGLDVVHDDPLVAELRAAEHGLERREQRAVAAPVGGQRLLRGGGAGGLEVRRDVTAAEGVDRLLRVADQHHRGVPGEGTVEHLPLHRVGVLELVDEHDRPPVAHAGTGRRRRVLERVGELAEEVVVREDAEPTLAPLHLLAHGRSERDPTLHRVRAGTLGLQRRLRVADGGARDRERVGPGEDRLVVGVGERPQVEVVDHLHEQVVEVLDEACLGVGVTGHAQGAEHQAAELVGGRDRRCVEARQRLDDAPVPTCPLVVVAVEQVHDEVGGHGVGECVPGEGALRLDQLRADPLP
jgi:hypothetical protein